VIKQKQNFDFSRTQQPTWCNQSLQAASGDQNDRKTLENGTAFQIFVQVIKFSR